MRSASLVRFECIRSLLALSLLAGAAHAAFDPPRIADVLNQSNSGQLSSRELADRRYVIDKGEQHGIHRGDVLNVYREKRLSRRVSETMRFYIGSMTITDLYPASCVGTFSPNLAVMEQSVIKYKTALKGDLVVPRLIIDSGVLFDPGSFELKPKAQEEFAKVADFVRLFSPGKLVIEGHTDADGERADNAVLSLKRAQQITRYLVDSYAFITPAMVEAKGYGEERPLVPNDTPENKALNRRIEVIVWQ